MTDAEQVYSRISDAVRKGRQPGSFREMALALNMEIPAVQEAVKLCRSNGWISMTKGQGQYDPLIYKVLDADREPMEHDRWRIDDLEYGAVVTINKGEFIDYQSLMAQQQADALISKAARNVASGRASAEERQMLLDYGVLEEKIARIEANLERRRNHEMDPLTAQAIRAASRSF